MNRDNSLIIILILLFFWWNRKNKSTITKPPLNNGGNGNNGDNTYTGDCNYILNGGNNPPVVWAEENGLLVNSSEGYLVGVDPELKGDFKMFYWCCPYPPDDPNRTPRILAGWKWIGHNDPEFYQPPIPLGVSNDNTYLIGFLHTQGLGFDATMLQKANQINSTNEAMTTTSNFQGSTAWIDKSRVHNIVQSTKWYGGGWGNPNAKLNSYNISFDWQKDDGSVATYSKSWDINWTNNNVTACII